MANMDQIERIAAEMTAGYNPSAKPSDLADQFRGMGRVSRRTFKHLARGWSQRQRAKAGM